MAVPREASDQNGAEFPVCVCAADGNCFLRHQSCESSDDFATETQYLEATGMIASIERYSAPFTVGTLYLLFGIFLERSPRLWGKISPYAALAAAVLLCANWGAVYDGMIGYRQRLDDDLQARSNMITEASEEFLEKCPNRTWAAGCGCCI